MPPRKISDKEVDEALHRAFIGLCPYDGESKAGNVALRVVRAKIVEARTVLTAKMDADAERD